MLRKTGIMAYAAGAYVLGLLNIAYIAGFIADVGVPKGISDGPAVAAWFAIAVDVTLVALFGLHHSITARRRFKNWWQRFVPPCIERPTYLYMTAAATAALVFFWRPVPATVWTVEQPVAVALIWTAYALVWAMMFASTFHFGHLAFFGVRQALDRVRDVAGADSPFTTRWLYGLVRHPISLGWALVPWLTPHMTIGQVVFAICTTIYVLAATPFEEADLAAELGDAYRQYRRRVPAFVPGSKSVSRKITTALQETSR